MAHDKAYTFVAALLRRSKNRTATNLDHYAKRSAWWDCHASRLKSSTIAEAVTSSCKDEFRRIECFARAFKKRQIMVCHNNHFLFSACLGMCPAKSDPALGDDRGSDAHIGACECELGQPIAVVSDLSP